MLDEKIIKQMTTAIMKIIISCILIYLCLNHIHYIADAFIWIIGKFKPLLIGGLIALILNIPMSFIEKKISHYRLKQQRLISIVISLIIIFGLIGLLLIIIVPELIHSVGIIVDSLDQFLKLNEDILLVNGLSENVDLSAIVLKLQNWIKSQSSSLMEAGMSTIKKLTSEVVMFFMGLIFSIYILGSKEKIKRQVTRLMTVWIPEKINKIIFYTSRVFSQTFQQYILGQVTEAIILGTLCFIGMFILQLPYAPMISTLVGFTALIPYIGGLLGSCIGFVLIFIVSPFQALVFIIYLIVLQQIEGNMIYPRIVGKRINLPPIWVFAAITLGGNFAGPLGMFFAVPIVSSALKILKKVTKYKENRICEG